MKARILTLTTLLLVSLPGLAACGPAAPASSPTPTPELSQSTRTLPAQDTPSPGGLVITGTAAIDTIDIRLLESMPVQVQVVAKGNFNDACTRIGDVTQSREGNTFKVKVTTARPPNVMCAQVITPFEHTISLDVQGLKAGTYTVDVNGVTSTFTLSADNVLK